MNCSGNFLNRKIKGIFCIRYRAPKLNKLPEWKSLFLPDCAPVLICFARPVVSWAFVPVGAALVTRSAPRQCFLVLRTWGEGLKRGFLCGQTDAAVGSFIPSFVLLLQFSFFYFSKKKKKKDKFLELILKWLLFQLCCFSKAPKPGEKEIFMQGWNKGGHQDTVSCWICDSPSNRLVSTKKLLK